MVAFACDFCGLLYPLAVTPAQHLLDWFTSERRQLIKYSAFDRLAKKSRGTFANFLNARAGVTLERAGIESYYPALLLVGYLPPSEFWTPTRALTSIETSSDIRTWVTAKRRALLNLSVIDIKSGRSKGFLHRYLKREPNLTLKNVGKQVYYPSLQLFGFVPPSSTPLVTAPLISDEAAEHLLTWFTPERRARISLHGIDELAQQPEDTFSRFLAGIGVLLQHRVQGYYDALSVVGYYPSLDLSQDVFVQRHLLEQQKPLK